MDAEAPDDAMERERDDQCVDAERDRRRDVEVRRRLDVSLPGDGDRHDERVHGEGVDEPGEPVLVEEHEAREHQRAGAEVGDVEGEAVHQPICEETKRSSVASSPSISAAPRKSLTRKTRILAISVSNTPSPKPAAASFSA